MEHRYTSSSHLEGAWLSDDSQAIVLCRWWWERAANSLHVMCGSRHVAWAPPPVNPDMEHRLLDDFPDIAKDVAQRL